MSQKREPIQTTTRASEIEPEFLRDVCTLFYGIHDCYELTEIWDPDWNRCPMCGSEEIQIGDNGIYVNHKVQ